MDEVILRVRGRVQGVNFRSNIKRFCDANFIKGFVKNEYDGSVIIVAQANKSRLDKLIEFVSKSPGLSKVESIEKDYRKPEKKYKEFRIERDENFFRDKIASFFNLSNYLLGRNIKVPLHLAIIPDGNRRWARSRGLHYSLGHKKAARYENVISLIRESQRLGIKYFSVWGFSCENWKRPEEERKILFGIITRLLSDLKKEAHKNKVRFRHLGRTDRLPKKLVNEIKKLEKETAKYDSFHVQLCLDYGGRDEIVRAIKKIDEKQKINEETFSKFLDTSGIPDPDLIIRTGGEKRLSGFMPYQSVYTELYFVDVYFPDFEVKHLRKAILDYSKRIRRFGS